MTNKHTFIYRFDTFFVLLLLGFNVFLSPFSRFILTRQRIKHNIRVFTNKEGKKKGRRSRNRSFNEHSGKTYTVYKVLFPFSNFILCQFKTHLHLFVCKYKDHSHLQPYQCKVLLNSYKLYKLGRLTETRTLNHLLESQSTFTSI